MTDLDDGVIARFSWVLLNHIYLIFQNIQYNTIQYSGLQVTGAASRDRNHLFRTSGALVSALGSLRSFFSCRFPEVKWTRARWWLGEGVSASPFRNDIVGIAASSLGDISPCPPFVAFACATCVLGHPWAPPLHKPSSKITILPAGETFFEYKAFQSNTLFSMPYVIHVFFHSAGLRLDLVRTHNFM